MTDTQRKRLDEAFRTLALGANRGRRMLTEGVSLGDVVAQVNALEELTRGMRESIEKAVGAGVVLDKVARAKVLSSSGAKRW